MEIEKALLITFLEGITKDVRKAKDDIKNNLINSNTLCLGKLDEIENNVIDILDLIQHHD